MCLGFLHSFLFPVKKERRRSRVSISGKEEEERRRHNHALILPNPLFLPLLKKFFLLLLANFLYFFLRLTNGRNGIKDTFIFLVEKCFSKKEDYHEEDCQDTGFFLGVCMNIKSDGSPRREKREKENPTRYLFFFVSRGGKKFI